jgi:hypothetical protein
MLRGTTASISARREAAPMTDSMCASSSGVGPDVAGDELGGVLQFGSGFRADISMAGCSGGGGQVGQGGGGGGQSVFSSAS